MVHFYELASLFLFNDLIMFRRGCLIAELRKYYTLSDSHIKKLSKVDKDIIYMFVKAEINKTNFLDYEKIAVMEKFNITIDDAINLY